MGKPLRQIYLKQHKYKLLCARGCCILIMDRYQEPGTGFCRRRERKDTIMIYEVTVIGGGASGMTAALTAARSGHSVLLLEKNERLGKKLAASGNGRGNLSNTHLNAGFYHGADPAFVKPALSAFGVEQTRDFFRSVGVVCRREEDGRLYPASNQASSVVDCLRFALAEAGVDIRLGVTAERIRRVNEGFAVDCGEESFSCRRLIVAAGGEASPKLGGTAEGYRLLTALGHHSTPRFPALVQLKTDNAYPRAMQGLKLDGTARIEAAGRTLAEAAGEILFTEYGVSGPAVFSISRAAAEAAGAGREAEVVLDLMPALSREELKDLLSRRCAECGYLTLENYFAGLLHKKLGVMLCRYCSLGPMTQTASCLGCGDIAALTEAIKAFRLPLRGTTGFANAQVTAGGIRTDEVDPFTMRSRLVQGLYLTGEVLDIDGACGGYNLQWAWSSGHLAGCLL